MSITGIGVPGSLVHVATNKNMSAKNKVKCLGEQLTEGSKPLGTAIAATVATAGTAAAVTGIFEKVAYALEECVEAGRDKLWGVSIENKNLAAVIENSKIGKAFLNLSTPGKAAVIAGTAAFAVFGTLAAHISNMKSAYIEGKNEQK